MADTQTDVAQDAEAVLVREHVARESLWQRSARWPAGYEAAASRPYALCTRTVMDTSDPDIRFDDAGVCHYVDAFRVTQAEQAAQIGDREAALRQAVARIRAAGAGKLYDCVIGLSGGVDSSYLCVLARELGLRPLVLHFDNGWNSETAVQNIERIVQRCGFDLETHVMDWPEFRDLQRSYFKASVLDLEVPTDHMIFGAIYKSAAKHGICTIISGNNLRTEWLLPRAWYFAKFDLANIKDIQKQYGTMPLRRLPALGLAEQIYYQQVRQIRPVMLLDLIDYDKPVAKQRLIEEFGWRDYGGKHHESVFTRFYQGYILPKKFNIDKRKAHLSNLVLAGQATRRDALAELVNPPYPVSQQRDDFTFVAKKLGFGEAEFEHILSQPNRSHLDFATDARARARYKTLLARVSPWKRRLIGPRDAGRPA